MNLCRSCVKLLEESQEGSLTFAGILPFVCEVERYLERTMPLGRHACGIFSLDNLGIAGADASQNPGAHPAIERLYAVGGIQWLVGFVGNLAAAPRSFEFCE